MKEYFYQPAYEASTYKVDIKEFLPYYQVETTNSAGETVFNDEAVWSWTWTQYVDDVAVGQISSVVCKDLIDSWQDMHQELKQEIFDLMGNPT